MKAFKQILFPIIILLIGIGTAFATNASKKTESMLETGYRFDPSATTVKCIATTVKCNDSGNLMCTWADANNVSHNLMKYVNDTTCGIMLYRIP